MKKIIVSVSIVVVFVLYAVFEHNASSVLPASTGRSSNSGTVATNAVGSFKDGTYTGTATDAFYGTVQVKALVQNEALTDVQFLQYPNTSGHTLELNNSVMPVLKKEAIQAQSANVAIISGATQTSQAFRDSLASALAQAK
jgi:uncharacterized protein with FMN-binding domain